MSQKTNNRPQHDRSKYLNDTENQSLFKLIEREDGVTLATAAIQLWLSRPPRHTEWSKENTGIICFVKDYTRKSYFFRLFNLAPKQLWEQELYTPFSYNKLTSNFHYFASDQSNAGFNFAFSDEAEKFYQIVTEKIMSKNNKKRTSNGTTVANTGEIGLPVKSANMSNMSLPSQQQQKPLASQPVNLNLPPPATLNNSSSSLSSAIGNKFNTVRGKNNKKKIDKSEISGSTGFRVNATGVRVVQHVGLTENNFEINLTAQDNVSRKMREMLSELFPNVKINKKTEKFLEDFINKHGGYQTFEEEIRQINNKSQAPRVNLPPPQQFQPTPTPSHAPPPPPPPPPPLPPQPPLPVAENTSKPSGPSTGAAAAAPPPLPPNLLFTDSKPVKPSTGGSVPPPPGASNPPPAAENSTILDQLKIELPKRIYFLNDSSEEDTDDSDSEWK